MTRCLTTTALLLASLLLCACASTESVRPVPRAAPAPTVLGPEDVFRVQVYQQESLSGQYHLDSNGDFTYPLVGAVHLAGSTPTEAARILAERLSDGFLLDPQVSILVEEFNSRKVSVIGQVREPGRYGYREGLTLVEAIAMAGGTTDSAILRTIQVTRNRNDAARYEVPFKDITQGKAPAFMLEPGDIIFVDESAVK
jgi:protein involved in polysaccharide export with SLBB domain